MSHLNINGVDKPLDHIRLNNVRSENLFDMTATNANNGYISDGYLKSDGSKNANVDYRASEYIAVSPNQSYTLRYGSNLNAPSVCFYDSSKNFISGIAYSGSWTVAFTTPQNAAFLRLSFRAIDPDKVMLNTGSTALPYQPYYITKEAWEARTRVILHGLTNPLCGIDTYKDTLDLSTGVLTRYVKKLVFDGTEDWSADRTDNFYTPVISDAARNSLVVCSHQTSTSTSLISENCFISSTGRFNITTTAVEHTTTAWKSYLATQYAAGAPVTVWYVLATPETEQIAVPSHLTGTIEGYLAQTGTPTPTNPIYPTANGTLEQGGTYSLDTGVYAIAWGRADTFNGTSSISARCYGLPVKSWEIDGNTQQSGTPAPDNIIMPDFVGERTENLFPLDATKLHIGRIESDGTIGYEAGTITVGTNSVTYQADTEWRGFYTDYIHADEKEQLTFSPNKNSTMSWSCSCYDENNNFLGRASAQSEDSIKKFTMLAGTKKVRLSVTSSSTEYTITNPILNTGSTALPYEPHGYKLNITSAGQTVSVYLGQVQTLRKIRKLVLTGGESENWQYNSQYGVMYGDFVVDYFRIGAIICYSTHFEAKQNVSSISQAQSGVSFMVSNQYDRIYIKNSQFDNVNTFKQWLADQYANGTPATVWYVLATPATGITNEPLAKIGTYADTLTSEQAGITIPTADGSTTISVDTTLAPSRFDIKVHAKPI